MAVTVPKGTIIVAAPECISGQKLLESARATGCRVVTAAVVPPEQEENILWHLVSTPKDPGTCEPFRCSTRIVSRPYSSKSAYCQGASLP